MLRTRLHNAHKSVGLAENPVLIDFWKLSYIISLEKTGSVFQNWCMEETNRRKQHVCEKL